MFPPSRPGSFRPTRSASPGSAIPPSPHANLRQYDPDSAAATRAAWTLRANETLGRYRSIGDPEQFATEVTSQVRKATGDLHLEVAYIRRPLLANPVAFSPTDEARFRASQLAANCGFSDVRFLPHNIGYLKLDMFPEVNVCGDTAITTMKTLSRADALIIDLRDNSGGSPDMVMFLAGWLFPHPAFFYNPRENDASHMWTRSPMAGSSLADKPIWVLTSPRTYSAAEHFSYNLKMLHRATLLGETTGGATDVGVFHRIDDHFGIGIRESRVRNPYPAPDWAVNGVSPNVRVPAADALETAEKLAAQQVARR
jgi:C-terminal processing protease CtpA/Prc